MHTTIFATLSAVFSLEISPTVIWTCTAGVILFVIAAWTTKDEFNRARGLEKVIALGNLCFAAPLAVFGAEHFADAKSIMQIVPSFMPWHLFWTYVVGIGLVAASLSIATKILVQWSGLLFGIMMFLFVAMMDLPGAISASHGRIAWILMCRELSFGCGGLLLAAAAMDARNTRLRETLITVGRVIIGIAAVFYGIQHFFHPVNAPGVPLEKVVPAWIPARALIGYVTGAALLVCGALIVLAKKTRTAATYLGAWILLIVVVIYGPILIASLLDPSTATKVEGINYFFDTLLYAGTILALANAAPRGA